MMNRRQMLEGSLAAGLGAASELFSAGSRGGPADGKIPLVHITDLYHPPQDPDDHIDLVTVFALEEFCVRGVILDVTQKFLEAAPAGFDISREPGFVPVTQLAYLLGRSVPVAAGPTRPLTDPEDDAADRAVREQAGIRLLLEILEDSRDPVVISIVGSARVLTAAFNRNPDLVHRKVRSVLLNAGSTAGPKREWNVNLDPAAYIGLWRSKLPVHWYPCATENGAFNPDHERGTYWKTTHGAILRDLPHPLRSWFLYGFTGDRQSDIIRVLAEEGNGGAWDNLLRGERNLWSTASLVMAAGRTLAETSQGWRFVAASGGAHVWPWRVDPIEARVNAQAEVQWQVVEKGGNALLFGRQRGGHFSEAMAEALNALLGAVPV